MGQNQSLDSMTQNQSKDKLLYQLVNTGNVEAIKALCREAVNLEWIDKEGKTPLIVAAMDSGLLNVARTLIEVGANVNAYRPGRHAGTPLHHAAKRGLQQTVLLLLSSGANALVRNDDCHTALDVARLKGHTTVVRAIENHIGYFSGWLRELHGPSFLEALAPQLLSRKIWVVVTPCSSSNLGKPVKLELAIYPTLQDSQPRSLIALWKAKIEEPNFQRTDPVFIIFDNSTKTRYKFASHNEEDKEQLRRFYDACRGINQVMPPPANHDAQTTFPRIGHQQSADALELAMAISASIASAAEERPASLNTHQGSETFNTNGWGSSSQGATHNGWGTAAAAAAQSASPNTHQGSETFNANGWGSSSQEASHNGWGLTVASAQSEASSSNNQGCSETQDTNIVHASGINTRWASPAPSAPFIPEGTIDEGLIRYPSIEGLVDSPVPLVEHGAPVKNDDGGGSSSCIICWEAPVEGACIPCGHMAGCMACLNEIKKNKGVCPVCRAKIKQIIRLYAV
ncbi:putative E3 ubiquitin-protein ligase XBAT34 [Euphorbia lathyris]|uniref:putative E3 ubiquitin-protein ligase XBAT34 n=1 Tax=Euphorbia lathyris TaxID=212925 RepID=UPI0033132662